MIVGATVGELPIVREMFPDIKLDMFFFVSITKSATPEFTIALLIAKAQAIVIRISHEMYLVYLRATLVCFVSFGVDDCRCNSG